MKALLCHCNNCDKNLIIKVLTGSDTSTGYTTPKNTKHLLYDTNSKLGVCPNCLVDEHLVTYDYQLHKEPSDPTWLLWVAVVLAQFPFWYIANRFYHAGLIFIFISGIISLLCITTFLIRRRF